jgi:YD repeat-containing protein
VANRPVRLIYENGARETFTYNDVGNISTYQTANGRTFTYHYNRAHRLITVSSSTGVKLLLRYDRLDNVAGICRTRVEAPDDYATCAEQGGELQTYVHDALGRMSERTLGSANGDGSTVNYTYNADSISYGPTGTEVTYQLDANGLGLLEQLVTPQQRYAFTYSALNQLASAGDLAFNYTDDGRAIGTQVGSSSLAYDFSPNGDLVVTDVNTGLAMQYQLEPRGFLTTISPAALPAPAVEVLHVTPQDVEVYQNDGVFYTQRLDERSLMEELFYFDSDFSNFHKVLYTTDQSDIVRRRTISLPQSPAEFSIVTGFDSDDRPVTMRITDSNQFEVRFVQSINYTADGLREGEAWVYGNGVQVSLNYEYKEGSAAVDQLARLRIDIVRPVQVSAGLWLLFAWVVLRNLKTRRRLVIGGTVVAGLSVGLMVLAQTAPPQSNTLGGESYTLVYAYDNGGNLTSVQDEATGTDCVTYSYNAVGQLTQVARADGDQTSYSYDPYGRITQADGVQLMYWGASNKLVMSNSGGVLYQYGQVENQPPAFAANPQQQLTWFLNDGQQRITQAIPAQATPTSDVWLFDPLRRYVSLRAPGEVFDPCDLTGVPDEVPDATRFQSLQDGTVWDAATNLYFVNGRTLEPETGLYLQPDPLGPDALGTVYGYPSRSVAPPIRKRPPAYTDGLYRLRNATETININHTLTAEAVRAEFGTPRLPGGADLFELQAKGREPFEATMHKMMALPEWLETEYNMPGPVRDAQTGAVRFSPFGTPAQTGGPAPGYMPAFDDLPRWDAAVTAPIQTPQDYVQSLMQYSTPPTEQFYKTYLPQGWQNRALNVTQTWQSPAPPVAPGQQPDAVLEWLPRTLESPVNAAYVLDTVQMLRAMPYQAPHDWIKTYTDEASPNWPELPSLDVDAWRETYFTEDTLGVQRGVFAPMPELPDIVMYPYGVNLDWLTNLER